MDASTRNRMSPLPRSQTTRSRPTSSTWRNTGGNTSSNRESGRGLAVPNHAHLHRLQEPSPPKGELEPAPTINPTSPKHINKYWKDGKFSKSSWSEPANEESFEQKTQEKSINMGMEQVMKLLGELQENEIASFLSWVRASSKLDQEASSEMPPLVNAVQPPTCPQPVPGQRPYLRCRALHT